MKPELSTQTASWLSQIVIRPLEKQDLPALEWDGEFRHFRRVYADAYRRYQRGLSMLWVAELIDKGVIGQVFIQLTCDRPELANGIDRAYLYSFRVQPLFRGAGLGSRIMQVVEDDLRERDYRFVTLNVAQDNRNAQRLYLRRGYQIIASEPGRWAYPDEKGIWHTVHEPAWRMEKIL